MSLVTIGAVRARDLASADLNGFSDPYVILSIGKQKKKTKIIKKNLNPEWNENFTFDITENTLKVHVYDWDLGSRDDFLGFVEINLSSVSMDGSEVWVPLGQEGKTKEKVSGDICLTFTRGAVASPTTRKNPSTIVDDIKGRIRVAQEGGGTQLDLHGCELAKIPGIVNQNFSGVQNFDLSFNKFTQFPDVFTFAQLQVLDLNGNQIQSIPGNINALGHLVELHMNGNLLSALPDEIGTLTNLEKLFLGNNRISNLTMQIGKLRKLEELSLTGNPLSEIPKSMGCLNNVEILDLSCCNLAHIPGEFTYMTKLLELNLATNELVDLPQSMGRMSRLVVLNLADNKLKNLPLSLGFCVGLSKFGAGANIERNEITDQEMLRKFKVGPDHMFDYLEKRMIVTGTPELEQFELPFGHAAAVKAPKSEVVPKWGANRAEQMGIQFNKGGVTAPSPMSQLKKTEAPAANAPTATAPPSSGAPGLDEKVLMLKKWAHSTIQQELRFQLKKIQEKTDSTSDPQEVVKMAQIIKQLKPAVDKARQEIPPFETPKPVGGATSKVDQVKAVISAALEELATTLRGIQKILETTDSSRDVVAMVQHVKGMKTILDGVQV